ncbi:DUF4018 domain-containing protein [Ectobacillus antri]|jgi:hypothetical protein|uniref:DUF4018 domain-containing protein n=1 Tax=Ectobacillus antri TaxID=2486280 RepID=A0ABT6H6Y9_9BACI|nr:DUF4018 domain-containing protein [Ectobacillus antri]MDG4657256.1 DUF4018 domain-containing protein [Ectobacillus antri]MDG5754392.1 DUF4018 domain-containing protein [Ectobacillus antri]
MLPTYLRYAANAILLILLSLQLRLPIAEVLLFLTLSSVLYILVARFKRLFVVVCMMQFATAVYVFPIIDGALLVCAYLVLVLKQDKTPKEMLLYTAGIPVIATFLHMEIASIESWLLLLLQGILTLVWTSHNHKQSMARLLIIVGVSVISFGLLLLLPYIRFVLAHIMGLLAYGAGEILKPLFEWLQLNAGSEVEEAAEKMKAGTPKWAEGVTQTNTSVTDWIYILAVVVMLSVISYICIRLMRKKQWHSVQLETAMAADSFVHMPNKRVPIKAPASPIRKQIFTLEKELREPFGRKRGETLESWLTRLEKEELIGNKHLLLIAYNTARYHDKHDVTLVKPLQQEIKQILKRQKYILKNKQQS